MSEIQHIILEGKRYVILPEEKYEQLAALEEDLLDIEAIRKYEKENPETFPSELINKILIDKEHPLKVFREYRGLTQTRLAELAEVTASYIAQIETDKRTGTAKVLSKIAKALKLKIEDITKVTF